MNIVFPEVCVFLVSNIVDFFVDIDRMQAHFENIQRIADTTTLPHAMHHLSSRIAEELDLSQLLERLQNAKNQPNSLTQSEKIELWDRLKIISMNILFIYLFNLHYCACNILASRFSLISLSQGYYD